MIKNDETDLIQKIRADPSLIKRIENPSEEVQLAAVTANGYTIEYIDNPSEEVQLTAVKSVGHAIKYINNPSEIVQMTAIEKDPFMINFIETPSVLIQDYVIKNDPRLFIKIHNLSTKILNANKDIIIKMLLQRIMSDNIYNDEFGDMLMILERHVTWPELDIINESLNSDIS